MGDSEKVTLEQWLAAYQEAEQLEHSIMIKLQEIHGKTVILSEYYAMVNEFFDKLYEQGETRSSLQNVSAFHGMIGSTIFSEFFKPGESRADLEGNRSILRHFRNKLRELESA